MKKLLIGVFLFLPLSAVADHWDVIEFKLRDGCSFADYLMVVADFNEWGKQYGYQTRTAAPLHTQDLTSHFWVGVSANAETFGKAWDAWRDALPDVDSEPAQINARLAGCMQLLSRSGFDIY